MNTYKLSRFLLLAFLLPVAAARAATWHVDAAGPAGAVPSLQEALDRAADGDEITVADGVYGPVSLASSKSLLVRSGNGPEKTAIAGGGTGRCATLCDGNGNAARLVTLEGFTLSGGVAASGEGGGAYGGCFVRCVFEGNAALRGGGAADAILENCLLTGNAAEVAGGGAVGSELVNCTVAGNRAGGTGGGASGCTLANCIVQANESPDGADAVACLAASSCTTPLVAGEGNTAADPCFADADAGDWRLSASSPCIDAGDGAFPAGAFDLAGNARVAGNAVDLGAYESTASARTVSAKVSRAAVAKDATVRTVTIAFDPNGGTCAVTEKTFEVGAGYIGCPKPVRKNHEFLGWFASPTGGGDRLRRTTLVQATDKKFYARWARTVTIAFDPNGGTCDVTQKTFRVGAGYIGCPKPVRKNHEFLGWFASPTGGGDRLRRTTLVQATDKKFYARWARVVTVAFDANGGKCSPAKKVLRVGTTYAGQVPRPKRAGYLCLGWYSAPKGDAQRLSGTTVVKATHKKFYARWARAVIVEFNPNGGTCSVAKKRYQVGKAYGSLPVPVRTGYVFLGWRAAGGVDVTESTKATAARTKLKARWQKAYTVHPVGDSMTYGVRTRNNPLLRNVKPSDVAKISNQGWRGYLRQRLAPWGRNHDRSVLFLGTHPESSWAGNVPHDGYPGERASVYAGNHKSAVAVKADIQIVFLGMNDALAISLKGGNYASYFSGSRDGYARVLSALGAGTTTPLTVLVTEPRVTDLIREHNAVYDPSAINKVITSYVNPFVRSQAAATVKILDIESFYRTGSYTDDGFHLSVAGNQELSRRLDAVIEDFWP